MLKGNIRSKTEVNKNIRGIVRRESIRVWALSVSGFVRF